MKKFKTLQKKEDFMRKILQVGMVLAMLMPAAVWAQHKGGLEIRTVSEIEIRQTNAEGKPELKRVDATRTKVLPGETVIFTNYYSYSGDKPATDVVIKNPVPANMVYVDGTAEGKETKIEFSVDKGKTYAAPSMLNVVSSDGKERRAVAANYTHIRWTIKKPLLKGAKGSVSFRAKVK